MTLKEAIEHIEIVGDLDLTSTKDKEALDIVLNEVVLSEVKKDLADGCTLCAFYDVEEWEMPCVKCKRNSKDYWRAKK